MLRFKKPRYKFYNNLLENVRNDFNLEKFKSLKWTRLKLKLKKNIYFQSNKLFFNKPDKLTKKLVIRNKFNFFVNHFISFLGSKKEIKFADNNSSIFSFWQHKRLKRSFKQNLLSKQKLKYFYNVQNYKLKNIIEKTSKSNNTRFNFIYDLEKRLDIVIYRSGIVKTLYQSRQLINHKKVFVNKFIQSKLDYRVKKGDLIEIKALDYFFNNNLLSVSKNKKKKKIYDKINYENLVLLNKINNFNIICKYFNLKHFNFYKIKNFYFFFYFFPIHMEVNYKTLSIVFIDNINIDKSFQFYINLVSLLNYYNTR